MKAKYLGIGFLVGVVVGGAAYALFGPQVRGNVAEVTRDAGEQVESVGKALKKQGDKLQP